MTRTVATKLAQARKLIERGWTQGFSARTIDGRPTFETSIDAAQWCAIGALSCVCNARQSDDYSGAIKVLRKAANSPDVVHWNDAPGRTQAEVIEAFKRAEQLAGAE